MAKQFDATVKTLVEVRPADWLAYAGLPPGDTISVVDADLSSITTVADKVIRVDGPKPYIAHFEFQSSADAELDRRVLLYNVLLRQRHLVPVRSVVILLRPKALTAAITGAVSEFNDADSLLEFRYRLIRVWDLPVKTVLKGGFGTLPLAPISNLGTASLQSVFAEIQRRLEPPVPTHVADEMLLASAILAGLCYPREVGEQLLKGVRQMEESTVYQAIIEKGIERGQAEGRARGRDEGRNEGRAEGRAEEAKLLLQRIATLRFGPPPAHILRELYALSDLERIEAMVDRAVNAQSWQDLLAE